MLVVATTPCLFQQIKVRKRDVGEGTKKKTVQTLLPQIKNLLYDQMAKAHKKAGHAACLTERF